jgi:beta-lactamase superfamily II metal-dependent hydrolase
LWKDILDDVEGFEIDGVRVGFLQPRGGFRVKDSSRPYPLIVKLTLGKISFIFGEGMMEKDVQRELVDVFRDRIKGGVLYIPRISEVGIVSFIHTVSPKSVVTNSASQAIMSAYEYKSLGVFQTDTQGTVTFLTDGNQVRVKTFVGEKYGFLQ